MSDDLMLYEKDGRIVTITINRPEIRNSISAYDMLDAFEAVFHKASLDHEVCCIILTGAGSAFSSGGDVKGFAETAAENQAFPNGTRHWYREGIQRIPMCLDKVEIPIIAAVNGPAIGAGCDLAMMCDIRIASDKALMGEVFVNLGIIPGDGGAWYLPRIVGRAKAFEMAFTGDVLKARECLDIGLVHKIVSHDDLMEACMTMAKKIASKPPEALRMTKRLLKESEAQSLSSSLEMAAGFQALAQSTRDHEEAAIAFVEKRKPVFTGR